MRRWLVIGVAAAVLSAACGGGGSSNTGDAGGAGGGSTAAADSFDANKLTAIVLRPEDVPPGLAASGTFNPGESNGVSFATSYGDNSFSIDSTVGRVPDRATRDGVFSHFRAAFARLVKGERDYPLAASDRAYIYQGNDPAQMATLAFKGEYFTLISVQSRDNSRASDAVDRAAIDRYTNLVWSRLEQLIRDPSSVTPIPNAPVYQTPVAGTPGAGTTDVPAATP